MIDNLVMIVFFVVIFGIMNFIGVRLRNKQNEASVSVESVESVEVGKAVPLPKTGFSFNEAASPEILSKRRHRKGW